MKDSEFMVWLHDRLINHYGENELDDFVRRTKEIADKLKKSEKAEFEWDLNND